MSSKPTGRKGPKRNRKSVNLTLSDTARDMGEILAGDRGIKLSQFVDGLEEEKRLRAEMQAATVPIYAIMRSAKLREMLPPDMREELERWQEIY